MTCWNGHVPRMNNAQMRQAVNAYYEAYARGFQARWAAQPWAPPVEPTHERPPTGPSGTALAEARPEDKVDVIDVEFVRVR